MDAISCKNIEIAFVKVYSSNIATVFDEIFDKKAIYYIIPWINNFILYIIRSFKMQV